jgi:hypothetical protein
METLSPYQKRFIAKGKLEGKQESILEILEARFGSRPEDIVLTVNRIHSRDSLAKLLLAAGQVTSLGDFRSLLIN